MNGQVKRSTADKDDGRGMPDAPARLGTRKVMSMYKRTKLRAVLAVASLLLGAACSREANQNSPVTTTSNTGTTNAPASTEVKQRGNALVRVIDAVPGGAAVEVFADDSKIFSGIAYKTASPYKEVSGERHTF